jgi:hypothetical protein
VEGISQTVFAQNCNPKQARPAYALRALGMSELPPAISLDGVEYGHVATIKHDFFAATGFYDDVSGRRVVLKVGRVVEFAGLPLKWLGRWLCRREMRFYSRLADLPNIPAILGTWGETGFIHEYVPGRPLSRDYPVPDRYFDRLTDLFGELHRRQIAYVDANKPQNILLGEDGLPHLIDFQISWDLMEFGNTAVNRWWLAKLQREDSAHLLKHKKRLRPDEMTEPEWEAVHRRSLLIRTHRFVFKPWFKLRRHTFNRLRQAGRLLPEGSK